MNKIILTFDLEYWYESLSLHKYLSGQESGLLAGFVDRLLSLLKLHDSQATFFITDQVLIQEPVAVEQIFKAGHEIAVHSLDHKPLWNKNTEEFNNELKILSEKIQKITGKKPDGHRAVNFSLDNSTQWALKILADHDFKYDSSILPFKVPFIFAPMFKKELYGIKSNLFKPYAINLNNITQSDQNSPLIELPIAVWNWGKLKYPVTGGIYIRLTPWFIFKTLLKNILSKRPACIHFHSFDFLDKAPDIKMPALKKLIKFYNTQNTLKKLEYVLKNFECVSVIKYIKEDYENLTHQSSNT